MLRRALFILMLLLPSAALADLRAVYSGELNYVLTVELADDGKMRGGLESGNELLVADGRSFVIDDRLTGPIVTRVEDLTAFWDEQAKRWPAHQPPASFILVPQGERTVNGRTGTAYFIRLDDGKLSDEPILVIGDDPSFSPLARAMARITSLDSRSEAASEQQVFRESAPLGIAMAAILEKGGVPLQVGNLKLISVQTGPIALDRFAVPAEPETGTALRVRLAAEAAEEKREEEAPSSDSMISQAVFSAGRLWLLTDGGRLSSLAESDSASRAEDPGGFVVDLCRGRDGPVVLTSDGKASTLLTVKRFSDGHWVTGPGVRRQRDGYVGMACATEGEIVLTSRRLIQPGPEETAELRLSSDLRRARVRPSFLVTPDDLYVGLNAGEWGGGLRRIDRSTGRVSVLERNATGELCDGPLNTACDPVNGIAPIPWKPGCVAAAVGLIHMMAHGRIVEICGSRIALLYTRPGEGLSPEKRAAVEAGSSSDSTAFFGIVQIGASLLAAGHDGLYRFNGPGAPDYRHLPRFRRVGDVLVSFELPDAILVITRINQRASVSGGAPLIVPR